MSKHTKRELEEELEQIRIRMEDAHAILSDALGYDEEAEETQEVMQPGARD